jgi:hypothetical protein
MPGEGGPGGGGELGPPLGGPGGAEEELEELPIEGYNYNKAKNVIMEYRRQILGKSPIGKRYNSGFDYLLNNHELDNLPGPTEKAEPRIGRVIAEEDWDKAKNEAEKILTEGAKTQTELDDDITLEDIPT